jgi:hypothetical protein
MTASIFVYCFPFHPDMGKPAKGNTKAGLVKTQPPLYRPSSSSFFFFYGSIISTILLYMFILIITSS